tara:strand:- start:95 stop:1117 length:1023 start_codon:yes stop_codon:yes gene_type:complete
MKYLIIFVSLISWFTACQQTISKQSALFSLPHEKIRKKLRKEIPALDFSRPKSFSPLVKEYLEYYRLDFSEYSAQHFLGTIKLKSFDIFAHYFKKENSRGQVLLIHGLFNHSGYMNNLIEFLLEERFSVLVVDLPGHGLSDGELAWVENFGVYENLLPELMGIFKKETKGPYHFIGHSTGASGIIGHLLKKRRTLFDKVILFAPLIESNSFAAGSFVLKLVPDFISYFPRFLRRTSSDEKFFSFMAEDPFQPRFITTRWTKEYVKWVENILKLRPFNKKMTVFQGDQDGTLNWENNREYLKEKFPLMKFKIIKGSEHQIFNESKKIKGQVFSLLKKEFDT